MLANLLWDGGRNNLRSALHALRKLPGADVWLETTAEHVKLHARSDLDRFETALRAGDTAAALKLWRSAGAGLDALNALLAGFELGDWGTSAFEDWLTQERRRVTELYLDLLVRRAKELIEGGQPEAALALLRERAAGDPLDEETHRHIMQLEWRRGNAAAALAQFEQCRKVLATELGLEPLETTQELFSAIRSSGQTPDTYRHLGDGLGGSGLDTFVGREAELRTLSDLTNSHRLVTVLGMGGSGKTRLVQEFRRRFGGGRVGFVPLATLSSERFVPAAIANALRLSQGSAADVKQLAQALASEATLLILDNAEHLEGLAGLVADLLERAPNLKLLVTSRRALALSAEEVLRLEGLEYPISDDSVSVRTQAVRLFVTRAHALEPTFSLNESNQQAVLSVCRTLRGLPLGLELAASWLRLYSPQALAELLQADSLQLENAGLDLKARHASLRGVVAQSWRQLEPEEQDGLSCLAVCRGGFDAEAALSVAGVNTQTLSRLADASLLTRQGNRRFTRHPLVYAFTREKLDAHPRAEAIRQAHAEVYLKRLVGQRAALLGDAPEDALALLDADFDNVAAALLTTAATLEPDAKGTGSSVLRAVEAFSLYADIRARSGEAQQLYSRATTLARDRPGLRGVFLTEDAAFRNRLGQHDEAFTLVEAALPALWGEVRTAALRLKASILLRLGRYPEAGAVLTEVLAVSRRGNPDSLSRDLRSLANVETVRGYYEAAEAHYLEAVALDRERGYVIGLAINLSNLSELLISQGRLQEAEDALAQSLSYTENVNPHLLAYQRLNQANLAFVRNDHGEAVTRARQSLELSRKQRQPNVESGAHSLLARVAIQSKNLAAARARLDRVVELTRATGEGGSLTLAQLVEGELELAKGNPVAARALLEAIVANPATEASVREAAAQLLADS